MVVCAGTTSLFVADLAGMVLTFVAAFLLGFAVASLEADVGLGSRLSGLAVFQVSVTLRYLSVSVTGRGEGFCGGVVALTTRPLGYGTTVTFVHLLGREPIIRVYFEKFPHFIF